MKKRRMRRHPLKNLKSAVNALFAKTRIEFRGEKERIINEIKHEILSLKFRCRTTFSGHWELDHSCYDGALEDLPYLTVRRWKEIIREVNSHISSLR